MRVWAVVFYGCTDYFLWVWNDIASAAAVLHWNVLLLYMNPPKSSYWLFLMTSSSSVSWLSRTGVWSLRDCSAAQSQLPCSAGIHKRLVVETLVVDFEFVLVFPGSGVSGHLVSTRYLSVIEVTGLLISPILSMSICSLPVTAERKQ